MNPPTDSAPFLLEQHPSGSYLPPLHGFLRKHLLDDIIPFWTTHAIDPDGGINTCIRDDGTIVSREKWLWSQWRALWVFSKLYNRIEPRAQWLDIARHIYNFTRRHGWDPDAGGWHLLLAADGAPLRGCDSIYTDGFAIYGLTEFAKATGEQQPLDLARSTADHVLRRLRLPHEQIPHFPYPVPTGARVHGLPMMFSLVLWELGQSTGDDRYRHAALEMSDDIFSHFYRPDRDLLLERLAVDNSEYPPPLGTAVVPGHAIEDMWFQIHIARETGDRTRIELACRLIQRHLEAGWDPEFGGILLAIDADGSADIGWNFPDAKLWWPQTEALYALLLAYEHTREPWCLDWYARVHDYCFTHFPLNEHGEWRQKLDRHGRPLEQTVALPVKDPFHLPRVLICCVDVLERLNQSPSTRAVH